MTTKEILELYKIRFVDERMEDSYVVKNFLGGGSMESFFFLLRDHEDIEEEVIRKIDHYLNGNKFEIENTVAVESELILIDPSGVKFINIESLIVEQIVPLDHFKSIAMARSDYNRT